MKALLFYPLMFLRPLLKIVLRLVGGLYTFGAIAFLFVDKDGAGWVSAMSLAFAFVIFLAGWFYDNLLLKLNPEGNVLILSR